MLKSVEKSVVRLKVSKYNMAWLNPWQYRDSQKTDSTGFCVETPIGKFIITNFHCINNYKDIIVYNFEGKEFTGTIVSHFASLDLAMISVPIGFWKNATCVNFTTPGKGETIYVLGYPGLYNVNLSISKGVINRLVQTEYIPRRLMALSYEVDVKVNPGNSGGLAVNAAGDCCGVPFQGCHTEDFERLQYIIPSFLVKYFMEKSVKIINKRQPIKHFYNTKFSMRMEYLQYTSVDGVGDIDILVQTLHDENIISVFGNKGLLITSIAENIKELQIYDVILTIGKVPILNSGFVDFKKVAKQYLNMDCEGCMESIDVISVYSFIGLISPGTKVEIEILRKGKPKTIKTIISTYDSNQYDFGFELPPCYLILYKLLIVPVSQMLLNELSVNQHLRNQIARASSFLRSSPGKQNLAIVDTFGNSFLDPDNKGTTMQIIDSVNNIRVNNLTHLYELVNKPARNYLIKFKNTTHIRIIPGNWKKTTMQVIKQHNIPHFYTPCNISSFSKVAKPKSEATAKKAASNSSSESEELSDLY